MTSSTGQSVDLELLMLVKSEIRAPGRVLHQVQLVLVDRGSDIFGRDECNPWAPQPPHVRPLGVGRKGGVAIESLDLG
ncbi:MAG: hypothetical protein M3R38_17290 [Actinomycetota bacterium]|nr:hypothetical protein [Actinomycetota bacterium]